MVIIVVLSRKKPQERIPMIKTSDIKRPRGVKAEFDPEFNATADGGSVLVEKVMRRLNIMGASKKYLPIRSELCQYTTEEAVYALIAGLLIGGRGIGAVDRLTMSEALKEIFGLEKGAPSPPTIYRVLCDLAGLKERKWEEAYREAGSCQARLDLGGKEKKGIESRRIVPDEPEEASEEKRKSLGDFLRAIARICAKAMPMSFMNLHGWYTVFGDGTDLEVEGECFDAARTGRDGDKILRMMSLMIGPITVGYEVLPGDADEGTRLPEMIGNAKEMIREIVGRARKVLAVLDAAFFEKEVIAEMERAKWDFIVCANQYRGCLQRLAEEQSDLIWDETGSDEKRGWRRSQVGVFTHTPAGWESPVTIVCRRWEEEKEIEGLWHYSFLGTRIEPEEMPKRLSRNYSYGQTVWMLYGTKQGRENHLKTPLRDLGLHHPPSCRLGVNQAFYAIALAAANIAMVMRYRVMPGENRGMQLWRIRECMIHIAGYIRKGGRRLWVYLSGGDTPLWLQTVWLRAFAEAGRL